MIRTQKPLSKITANRLNHKLAIDGILLRRNSSFSGWCRNSYQRCLLIILACLFVTTGSTAQGERILHNPLNFTTKGLPVVIEADIESSSEIPVEARIYYRMSGQDAYNYVEMEIDRFNLKCTIPGEVIDDDVLEYYFEVTFAGDRKISYPEGAPVSDSPIQIVIRPVGAGEGENEKALIILSPEPASVLSESRILVAVSIMQHIRSIDPSKLTIVFDGIDVTRSASLSEDMATLIIEDVKPGEHHIAFYLKAGKKREKLAGWGFVMRSPEEVTRPPGVFKGGVNTGYSRENVSSEVRDVTWIDGRINGKYKDLEYATKAYVTNLERGNQQPQNRFMASLRYKALTVRAGDIQPQLSEFSLWGSRTRGAQLALKSQYFNMDAVWGFMRRKVDGDGYMDTVKVVNPITEDTLKSVVDPALDSTRVELFITEPSTYSRQLMAFRPAFNFGRSATWGINIVKVKDDVNSVEYGQRPVDNLVLGTDLKMYFDHRRIAFTTESSISLYNSDISEGAMSDAELFENIIVVNQYFEPLPTDSSVLDTTTSTIDKVKELAGEIVKSSSAHRTNLVLNYFKNELRLGYKNIGRSYKSLGSPTVLTDVNGFTIQDRIRLLNNRLYLTVGYEGYSDNVNERGATTTDRNIIRSNISYYSPPRYPNISIGLRRHNRQNDGDIIEYTLPNDSTETVDNRIKSSTLTYNMGIDQSFKYAGFANNVRLSFSNSGTDDKIDQSGYSNSIMYSFGLTLSSQKGQILQNSASIRRTSQESQGGRFLVDYNAVSLNSRYMLISDQLWISGGVSVTLADGESIVTPNIPDLPAPTVPDSLISDQVHRSLIKYNRMHLSAGAEYNLTLQHQFRFSIFKVISTDDGSVEYWDWVSPQWKPKSVKNEDSAEFVDQGDFVARLTYSYTF